MVFHDVRDDRGTLSELITGQYSMSLALRLDFYMPPSFAPGKKLGEEFFHP